MKIITDPVRVTLIARTRIEWEALADASETEQDGIEPDAIIVNDSDLNELEMRVGTALRLDLGVPR